MSCSNGGHRASYAASLAETQHEAKNLALLGSVAADKPVAMHVQQTLANVRELAAQLTLPLETLKPTTYLMGHRTATLKSVQDFLTSVFSRQRVGIIDEAPEARFQVSIG